MRRRLRRKARTVIFPEVFKISTAWAIPYFFSILFLISSFTAPAPAAHTQREPKPGQPYALIFGTVWGPNDHPVYGVKVKIRRAQDKKAKWELVSDHQGEFAQRLPAGKADYVIWADLRNFKAADGTILRAGAEAAVHVNNDERVDIGLHLTR